MCLATKFDAVSCLLWSDDFSYLKKKKIQNCQNYSESHFVFRSFFSWIFFFITEFENMKESTMVLWVFFFWGGGVPAVTGIWYQLFMSDSLTNKQRSPASLLSTQHLSDSLLAGKKKQKTQKTFSSHHSRKSNTPLACAHSLTLTQFFFPFTRVLPPRGARARSPPLLPTVNISFSWAHGYIQ